MIYQLVLMKNNPWANTALKRQPVDVHNEWEKVFSNEAREKAGQKWISMCDCAWANEEYSFFGIATYKDIPARIARVKEIEKAGWYDYVDLFTLLGTDMDGNGPQPQPYPNPIYQLWMIRSNPTAETNLARLTEEERNVLFGNMMEAAKKTGAHFVIRCKSYWANEEYPLFGLTAFPNIEARQAYADELQKLNWSRYITAFTLLGVARE